ncbi:MAG: hypothetical protein AAF570_28635, partial [Bacteroidota bacterium]
PLFVLLLFSEIPSLSPKIFAIGFAAFMLVNFSGLLLTARSHSTGRPLWEYPQQKILPGYSFFETGNRVHARDLPTIEALDDILKRVTESEPTPPRILSQQAGMVIFHTARKYFNQIEFIDLVGLCTKHFHECELTRTRGKTYGGLNMDLYYLFQDRQVIEDACGFTPPDIIFDLDNERHEKEKWLLDQGYGTVYRQTGWMRGAPNSFFPGLEIGAWQIIMVRRDWIRKYDLELKTVDFGE